MSSLKNLKIGFDRKLRNIVSFNTATIWLTAAVLAWIGDLGGSRCLAVVLTLLALYLRFVRIPEHRDHRFRPKVITDSGIPITHSGDRDH